MSAISKAFDNLSKSGTQGVIPYITAGFPSLEVTEEIIVALGEAGATTIEVGVPFSDPMADGPVIQRACEHSLRQHVTLTKTLATVKAARQKTEVPIVLFSYLNPLLQYGLSRLAKDAAESGVSGILLTDLPTDLAHGFATELKKYELDLISLVAPTSTDERLRQIAASASGFLYAVSRTGVTGTQSQISADASELVARIRNTTTLPIALGFGISDVAQAREAWRYADAVVIGSALVRLLGEVPPSQAAKAAGDFLRQFTVLQAATAATEK